MKAIELFAPRIDALRPTMLPDPTPRADEVIVRMRAASLNFLDIAVATGVIPIPVFPIIPVTDGAGDIVDIGSDVVGWSLGERVVPHFMPDWHDGAMTPAFIAARRGLTRQGSLAEFVSVAATSLVQVPAHLSFEEASTLPIAATTAWRAVREAGLGPHSTALLLGTGGVSIFALQFAKAHGARVIITSSSDEKLERARALGADDTINYRTTPKWDEEALKLTSGHGADLVLETGGTETLSRSLNAAAMSGTIFVIGFLSGSEASINVVTIIEKALRMQGNNAGPVADLADAMAAIEAHRIVPVIDQVFSMADVSRAYSELAAGGRHFGKLVISVN